MQTEVTAGQDDMHQRPRGRSRFLAGKRLNNIYIVNWTDYCVNNLWATSELGKTSTSGMKTLIVEMVSNWCNSNITGSVAVNGSCPRGIQLPTLTISYSLGLSFFSSSFIKDPPTGPDILGFLTTSLCLHLINTKYLADDTWMTTNMLTPR